MKEYPFPVIWRSIKLLSSGQAHFSWQNVGQMVTRPSGRSYKIFRQVVMKPQPGRPQQAAAVFCVWFNTRTSPAVTIASSWLTLLFFSGMQGFRSKTWLYDEDSGEFGGIYEWDTLEQAEEYGRSFAMRMSALRSVPGMFSKESYPIDDPRTAMHAAVRLEPAVTVPAQPALQPIELA